MIGELQHASSDALFCGDSWGSSPALATAAMIAAQPAQAAEPLVTRFLEGGSNWVAEQE